MNNNIKIKGLLSLGVWGLYTWIAIAIWQSPTRALLVWACTTAWTYALCTGLESMQEEEREVIS